MNQQPVTVTLPSDEAPPYFIFRPRAKLIGAQLLVLLGILHFLGAIASVLANFTEIAVWLAICAGVAMFAVVALRYAVWYLRSAPRAIVACDRFLGILTHSGEQHRIPWTSIASARHSIGYLGMQWELDLIPAGRIVLHDIGMAPLRWGILRFMIINAGGESGAAVLVDSLSESIYPGQ